MELVFKIDMKAEFHDAAETAEQGSGEASGA